MENAKVCNQNIKAQNRMQKKEEKKKHVIFISEFK